MDSRKYIGMDVHKESISIAVRNDAGKVVMECVIETKASIILQFIDGLRGDLQVTFEEGTWAAWLYDLLKPHVTKLVVCDPRKNVSMREGNQSDKIDARRLAELLRRSRFIQPRVNRLYARRKNAELFLGHVTAQNIKRVTVSVREFADEVCGGGLVTIKVCPLQVQLQFRLIDRNVDECTV